MADVLDLEALRRELAQCDADRETIAASTGRDEPDTEWTCVVRLDRFRAILAALERAEEVSQLTAASLIKAADARSENALLVAEIERLERVKDAALERISELERRMHGLELERDSAQQGDQNAQAIARHWRERAERVAAAAREADQAYTAGWALADDDNMWPTAEFQAFCNAMNVLGERLAAAFEDREKIAEQDESGFEPEPAGSHAADLAERIERALFHAPDTPAAVETLTQLLEQTRQERDVALAAAAHWRSNAAEAERRKRHVSGLLSEKCRDLEALRGASRELADSLIFEASSDPDVGRRRAPWQAPMAEARDKVRALLHEKGRGERE